MFGLSFLSPLYLLGALAVALPIALHLFRRRTDVVVEFPAVHLLQASPVRQQRRRRLRELILLALRVTALVLLAGAFARPYFAGAAIAADTPVTVVAIDTSFSLSSPAVFERARALSAAALRDAPSGHAVALVAFDETPATVVAPTMDRGATVAALAGVAPGASATRYAAAVARAAEVIGRRQGRVEIITDLQQSGWAAAGGSGLPDDVEVVVRPVEAPIHNVAVTRVTRREGRVEADLFNFGFEARTVPVRLHVFATGSDSAVGAHVASAGTLPEPATELSVVVGARASAQVRFDVALPEAGAAAVGVVDPEGMAADDLRFLVLDPPEPVRVTVIVADPTGLRGGLYVERALQAAGADRRFEVTVIDGRAVSSWTSEQASGGHALVVLGTRTLERRGRDLIASALAAGASALVATGPDIDPRTLADVLGFAPGVGEAAQSFGPAGATLVLGDTRHPVFRVFAAPAAALGDVAVDRYRRIDETARAVLARFSGGPAALVEVPRERGRVLLFASDLDNQWNRFPLSPAFVPFIVEAVDYLTLDGRAQPEYLLPATPAGSRAVPGVVVVPSETAGGRPASSTTRRVALNVDTRESNPASMTAQAFLDTVPRLPRVPTADPAADAQRAEDEQRLWQVGLLVMLAALAGEGLIGRRAT